MLQISNDALEGLSSLEYLDVSDNKLLQLPSGALSRLPSLRRLKADYNRIGSIGGGSGEEGSSVEAKSLAQSTPLLEELSLAYNIIRDLPPGSLAGMGGLKILNLHGNKLTSVGQDSFEGGAQDTLEYLDLGHNAINQIRGELALSNVKYLSLEKNKLGVIDGAFNLLGTLQVLELADNMIGKLSEMTFMGMDSLISLDLSGNKIRKLSPGVLKNQYLNEVNMSGNSLEELETGTFSDLSILEVLDLSGNRISSIQDGAFDNIPRLKRLLISDNELSSYRGDYFVDHGTNDTDLHTLDLSGNQITYLYPESFSRHPQLAAIDFSQNKFSFFPTQFIRGLKSLSELNLSGNLIKSVDDGDFANLNALQKLDLSRNGIESVSGTAFQNSSQLQYVDLSSNSIQELESDTFLGSVRLILNLANNMLKQFPEGLFERPKVMQLQELDLSHNQFEEVPVGVLQDQYFYLDILKIAHNKIKDIPSAANVLVNVKEIDISFNPLTEESIGNVLNEPKTVRSLNMAGTGIKEVPVLETPFLTHLNLSGNEIRILNDDILSKPALVSLDVSGNQIPNLSFGLTSAWTKLKTLRHLNISGNPIKYIIKGDFKYLDGLKSLVMNDLVKCTKVERGAFANLNSLARFEMNNLPRVNFVDVRGILRHFGALEEVEVEVKDALVGDHFSPAYTPRLRKVGFSGGKVKNIAIGALNGLSSKEVEISVKDTQVKE